MNLKLDNIIMDPSNDKFKDECGVFGIYSNNPLDVASVTYYGLYALQHRGQESAGIAVANGEDINIKKTKQKMIRILVISIVFALTAISIAYGCKYL